MYEPPFFVCFLGMLVDVSMASLTAGPAHIDKIAGLVKSWPLM